MFLHVSVILSTGGEYLGRYPPQDQVHTPRPDTPPRTRYPPGPGTPPQEQYMLGDTGKRAVRILLECILVDLFISASLELAKFFHEPLN